MNLRNIGAKVIAEHSKEHADFQKLYKKRSILRNFFKMLAKAM